MLFRHEQYTPVQLCILSLHQVRVITLFGEAKIHLTLDHSKLQQVCDEYSSTTLPTENDDGDDAARTSAVSADVAAVPNVRASFTQRGLEALISNMFAALNLVKLCEPILENYLKSSMFAEQVTATPGSCLLWTP